jgi:hypothetical protein
MNVSDWPRDLSRLSPLAGPPSFCGGVRRRIRAEFDPGDHLHSNDVGYQAMADAIDVAIFTCQRALAAPGKR